MNVDDGNSARIIVEMIAKVLGFKIHSDTNGISAYGGKAIRISDHRTYMQTWVDNHTWNSPKRLDIVIEDDETQGTTDVQNGYIFNIDEYIYSSSALDIQSIKLIAFDILNVQKGQEYANNARGEHIILTSTNSSQGSYKQLDCNRNMNTNKKTIRLTETKFKQMLVECITKIFNEIV